MLVTAGAVYGLAATSAFGFERLEIRGTTITTETAIRDQLGLADGTNLVGLVTDPIEARLRRLPAVGGVEVSVGLPDVLHVSVTERMPIVIWAIADRRYAVDATGYLFAEVSNNPSPDIKSIPVVVDERIATFPLGVTSSLDPTDLDAATRLGSLTPGQIGSHAASLRVHITDQRGFTVTSGRDGWLAVFGFYGRNQRTPDLISGQVQLLGALLAGREDTVQTVILADDKEGTYVPKATPKPTPTPKVTPRP
jgi:hypothetical protein